MKAIGAILKIFCRCCYCLYHYNRTYVYISYIYMLGGLPSARFARQPPARYARWNLGEKCGVKTGNTSHSYSRPLCHF